MKISVLLAGAVVLAFSPEAFARGGGHGAHSYVSYGGGHHTVSHGGKFKGGAGSSHKGGSYMNANTGNQYGTHK